MHVKPPATPFAPDQWPPRLEIRPRYTTEFTPRNPVPGRCPWAPCPELVVPERMAAIWTLGERAEMLDSVVALDHDRSRPYHEVPRDQGLAGGPPSGVDAACCG